MAPEPPAIAPRRPGGVDALSLKHGAMCHDWAPCARLFSGAGLGDGDCCAYQRDIEWRLRGLLLPSDVVIATWRHDGHPDHEAVGRLAAHACATLLIHLVEVPIWAWQWSFPGDRRIPWNRARRIFLDPVLRARNRLARLARPYEIVFV